MSNRIDKVNSLIKRELSEIILKEMDFPVGCLVTVTKVETTKDLSQSFVWISVLPEGQRPQIFEVLEKSAGHLNYLLAKRLIMWKVPHIFFKIDSREEKASHIEELLDQIGQQKHKKKD